MLFAIPESFSAASGKLLITVGESEKSVMRRSAEDLVNAHSNAVGVILPGVGHGAPLAAPDYFNHLLKGWITADELPEGSRLIES